MPELEEFRHNSSKRFLQLDSSSSEIVGPNGWIVEFTLSEELSSVTKVLDDRLVSFETILGNDDRHKFSEQETECVALLQEVLKAKLIRDTKSQSRKRWRLNLDENTARFCETAMHYEKIFDVLNSQAPEYTSPIWASIKLLLLYNVNDKKLRTQVAKYLEDIGQLLSELGAISVLQPVPQVRKVVTKTLRDFVAFLQEALKYYEESRIGRIRRTFTQPWETRFLEIVSQIKDDVHTVYQVAQVCILNNSQKLSESMVRVAGRLEDQSVQIGIIDATTRNTLESVNQMLQGGIEMRQYMHAMGTWIRLQNEAFKSLAIWRPETMNKLLLDQTRWQHRIASGEPTTGQYPFLSDLILSDTRKMNEAVEESVHCSLASNQTSAVFPQLDCADNESHERLLQYEISRHGTSPSRSNVQMAFLTDVEVTKWLGSGRSHLLWVEGTNEPGPLNWTTILSIEFSQLPRTTHATDAVLEYFCSGDYNSRYQAGRLLQTFIAQLINQCNDRIGPSACHERGLRLDRFHEAGNDLVSLWSLFAACLEICKAQLIYIIIDNADTIWSDSNKNTRDTLELRSQLSEFLDGLAKSNPPHGPHFKILVTSRAVGSFSLFQSDLPQQQGAPSMSHHSLLHIPAQYQTGTMERSQSLLRLPEEQRSKSVSDDGQEDWSGTPPEVDLSRPKTSKSHQRTRRGTSDGESDLEISYSDHSDEDLKRSPLAHRRKHQSTTKKLSRDSFSDTESLRDILESSASEASSSDFDIEYDSDGDIRLKARVKRKRIQDATTGAEDEEVDQTGAVDSDDDSLGSLSD